MLFELWLSVTPADEKTLHLLAKDLAAAGAALALGDYAAVKTRLHHPEAEALATFLTRAEAEKLSQVLLRHQRGHEIRPQQTLAAAAAAAGTRWQARLFLAVAIFAAAAAGIYYFYFLHRPAAPVFPAASEQSPAPPSATAPALPVPKELKDENLPKEIKLSANNIRNLVKATVAISDGQAIGSGFFVDRRGVILTNAHVVHQMPRLAVLTSDGRQFAARLLGEDAYHDLAVLRIEGNNFPVLPLGDATQLNQGDTVYTIGSPHGLNFTLTKGIVSYLGRKFEGKAYIQSDVAINQGNSGGPMINEQGEVVGVNTFIIRDQLTQGLNFALPINYAVMGERAILRPVIGAVAENPTFAEWARAEAAAAPATPGWQQAPSVPKHPSPAVPPAAPGVSTSLLELYQSDRQALQEFEARRSVLEAEKAALQTQQLAANSKYQDAAASKTVSDEMKLAKAVRELDLKLAAKDVELQQGQVDYYRNRLERLRRLVGEETDEGRRQSAAIEVQKMQQAQKVVELNLAAAKQTLAEVSARKY